METLKTLLDDGNAILAMSIEFLKAIYVKEETEQSEQLEYSRLRATSDLADQLEYSELQARNANLASNEIEQINFDRIMSEFGIENRFSTSFDYAAYILIKMSDSILRYCSHDQRPELERLLTLLPQEDIAFVQSKSSDTEATRMHEIFGKLRNEDILHEVDKFYGYIKDQTSTMPFIKASDLTGILSELDKLKLEQSELNLTERVKDWMVEFEFENKFETANEFATYIFIKMSDVIRRYCSPDQKTEVERLLHLLTPADIAYAKRQGYEVEEMRKIFKKITDDTESRIVADASEKARLAADAAEEARHATEDIDDADITLVEAVARRAEETKSIALAAAENAAAIQQEAPRIAARKVAMELNEFYGYMNEQCSQILKKKGATNLNSKIEQLEALNLLGDNSSQTLLQRYDEMRLMRERDRELTSENPESKMLLCDQLKLKYKELLLIVPELKKIKLTNPIHHKISKIISEFDEDCSKGSVSMQTYVEYLEEMNAFITKYIIPYVQHDPYYSKIADLVNPMKAAMSRLFYVQIVNNSTTGILLKDWNKNAKGNIQKGLRSVITKSELDEIVETQDTKKIIYFLHIMPKLTKLFSSNQSVREFMHSKETELQHVQQSLEKETSVDVRSDLSRTISRLTDELEKLRAKSKRVQTEIMTLITETKLATSSSVITTLGGHKKTRQKRKLIHNKKTKKKKSMM
jgi:hypothetical protein